VANRLPVYIARLHYKYVGYLKMATDFTLGQQFKRLKKQKVVFWGLWSWVLADKVRIIALVLSLFQC